MCFDHEYFLAAKQWREKLSFEFLAEEVVLAEIPNL